MKKSILLATAIVTSALWAGLALAVDVTPTPAPDGTAPVVDPAAADPAAPAAVEPGQIPEAQKEYFLKREEMKQRRDEALKLRERNVQGNNPGQTGL